MKQSLLDYLACPACHQSYELRAHAEDRGETITGELICAGGHRVPVVRGVPRFVASYHPTARAFAYSWGSFPKLHAYEAEQLLDWVAPLRLEDFKDRVVLDAGCGKGRHLTVASESGATVAIGADLSDAVDIAWEHTRHLPNAHVIQADILHLPLRPNFDLIFSVGVLHHMDDPRAGYVALTRLLAPRGLLATWFYAREGNGWIIYLLNPMRTYLTSRLPHGALRVVSFAPALFIWAWARVASAFGKIGIHLPYYEYLRWFARYPFGEAYSIVFDHLIPPVAYYLRGSELKQWAAEAGLSLSSLAWFRQMSWTMHARKT